MKGGTVCCSLPFSKPWSFQAFLLPKVGGGKKAGPCQIIDAGYQLILLFTVHTARELLVFGSELEFICRVQDRAACLFSSGAFGWCLVVALSGDVLCCFLCMHFNTL